MVYLFVVIQIYNKFSGFLLFLQLSTIYHSKCRMTPNNTTQKFHNHPYSDFRNTNRTTIIIKKELMMFFKNYGIKGISLLRGGLGEDIKKGRRKAGCMSLFEEACFPSSFCFYSFLEGFVLRPGRRLPFLLFGGYCRKEMSTPAATAEPMTPEMLLAMQ